MAEAIAIGASVIAIIQIADRIVGLCKFYIETARDAPADLRVILIETSTLKAILESVEYLSAHDRVHPKLSENSYDLSSLIEECYRTVAELENLFPRDGSKTTAQKGSKKMKLEFLLTALAWPLKEKKAQRLLAELTRYKTAIGLALTNSIA